MITIRVAVGKEVLKASAKDINEAIRLIRDEAMKKVR